MVTGNNTATATDTNAMEIRTTTGILDSTTPAEAPLSSMALSSGLQESQAETTSGLPDTTSTSSASVPEACLFCPNLSTNFQANLTHMQKSHGLFIPTSIDDGGLSLAVDMETLTAYMHLVIFSYHECLFCGTQRADGWAARQHMMGRGHCRIDLANTDSEWRDFYEADENLLSEDQGEDESEDEAGESSADGEQRTAQARADGKSQPVVDGDSLRLSSGKIISHRSTPAPKDPLRKPLAKHTRRGDRGLLLEEDFISNPQQPSTTSSNSSTENSSSNPAVTSQNQSLSRADRRLLGANKSAVTAAMATMSKRDRAALVHLSPAERRAMVVSQFKQQDRVHIAKRKYWSKFERRQDIPAEGGKVYIGGG